METPSDIGALAATVKEGLERIQQILSDLAHTIKATEKRQGEQVNREHKVAAEIRLPTAVERERSTEQRKQHRTQKIIAAGTWAAFIAATIYAAIAANQLREMRRATKAATDAATAAQQANIDAASRFQEDERPYIWFTNTGTGTPEFHPSPNTNPPTGQAVWSFHYTDYGKAPAYGLQFVREEIKVGSKFTIMFQKAYHSGIGTINPPQKDDFATIPSNPITPEEFNRLLRTDRSIAIRVRVDYADAGGTLYESGFCESHLSTGASEYCQDDNYVKMLSKPSPGTPDAPRP